MAENTWREHRLVFALESPLHIGAGKVGNLQRTRSYLPGRNLWAAMTERLVRDTIPSPTSKHYKCMGNQVAKNLIFSYFYPALKEGKKYKRYHPWEEENCFAFLFLDSIGSTAIDHSRGAAEHGSLHEVEFIRPKARPRSRECLGPQVYLVGALYERVGGTPEGWCRALERLQVGGERGYGWGRLRLAQGPQKDNPAKECTRQWPVKELEAGDYTDAHVLIYNGTSPPEGLIQGTIEPLIGWERNNEKRARSPWHLSQADIAYAPGALLSQRARFRVAEYGRWRYLDEAPA